MELYLPVSKIEYRFMNHTKFYCWTGLVGAHSYEEILFDWDLWQRCSVSIFRA